MVYKPIIFHYNCLTIINHHEPLISPLTMVVFVENHSSHHHVHPWYPDKFSARDDFRQPAKDRIHAKSEVFCSSTLAGK